MNHNSKSYVRRWTASTKNFSTGTRSSTHHYQLRYQRTTTYRLWIKWASQ